ncbi:hypothetical protein SAMN05421505_10331 [Sinosporangium album]|uniref:Uncharacterized protein n=1 Tax=Sinosporangium album TaxID=504805 RepID=A0A1G7SZE9_9ACTN|nr:hypothetical protein [Sinosporangium album]SDG28341.1 hypothetical protein SAMN05421505_10331 [Sinosporangium album]
MSISQDARHLMRLQVRLVGLGVRARLGQGPDSRPCLDVPDRSGLVWKVRVRSGVVCWGDGLGDRLAVDQVEAAALADASVSGVAEGRHGKSAVAVV